VAVGHLVTRGYGTGSLAGDPNLVALRGYTSLVETSPDITKGVEFDGTQRVARSNVSGAADQNGITISFWFKRDGNPASTEQLFRAQKGAAVVETEVQVKLNSSGTLEVVVEDETDWLGQAVVSGLTDGEWHHVLVSWFTTGGHWRAVDGVRSSVTHTRTQTPSTDFDFAVVGSAASGSQANPYSGCVGELWLHHAFLTDSDASVEKFRSTAGAPVDLGQSGQLPTGGSPVIYLSGGPTVFHENNGTGGAFTTTGTLVVCPLEFPALLSPASLAQLQELTQPGLLADSVLSPSALVQLQELTQPGLLADSVLSPASLAQLQELVQAGLLSDSVLSPASLAQFQELAQPVLLIPGELVPDGLVQLQLLTQPGLLADSVLSPASMTQLQLLSQPVLEALDEGTLSPADLTQIQILLQPGLVSDAVLSPALLLQVQTLGQPVVLPLAVLSPLSLTQLQDLASPGVSFRELLLIDDLSQLQVLTQPGLATIGAVAPDNLIQANLLTSATVFVPGVVGPSLLLELSVPELLRVLDTSQGLVVRNSGQQALVKGEDL